MLIHRGSCFTCWALIKFTTRAPFVHGCGDLPAAYGIMMDFRGCGWCSTPFGHACRNLPVACEDHDRLFEVVNLNSEFPLPTAFGTFQLPERQWDYDRLQRGWLMQSYLSAAVVTFQFWKKHGWLQRWWVLSLCPQLWGIFQCHDWL